MRRAQGPVRNHKRTERLCGKEGLQVRTRRRKQLNRPSVRLVLPDRVNQHWFKSLADAKRLSKNWGYHYNNVRLQSSHCSG
jgi:hypothetical protein